MNLESINGIKSTQLKRGTTTKTWMTFGYRWLHVACKYMQGPSIPPEVRLHKRMPPSGIYVTSISGTLSYTSMYRQTTEPIFVQDQT